MPTPRRISLLPVLLSALALTPAASASAASFPSLVPHGGAALPAGARDLGRVRPDVALHLTVALRPRRERALAAYAAAVSKPGSADYHHYLSVGAFADRFAPTAAQIRTVRSSLRARGLLLGATSPNGLSIPVRGSAAVAGAAFATTIDRYALRDGMTEDAASSAPALGGAAGGLVQGVVGFDTVAPGASVHFRDARAGSAPVPAVRSTGRVATLPGPKACASANATALASGGETADGIAAHYGIENFWAGGDEGSGVTIALYELEPFSASDIAEYQACMGTDTSVTTVPVDGGAGTGYGSGEAAMDVEDLIGLAPQAQIRVYEGPQTGLGAFDTYSAIVSSDASQVVSTSWGLCEAEEGRTAALAESVLFQEAAVQGQSVLAAAGDSGSDDCGQGTAGVDDPGSQPWVTSVGGTHFAASGDTVWDNSNGAGGGGVSSLWSRPAWQSSAVAQSSVTCGTGGTGCREVPDISADADPTTGYVAFYHGGWRVAGGTSVAAPTVAALAALADASPACVGAHLGFLDPALYADAADLHDVTSGTNSFGGVAGFGAGPGYDMASGLGTPTAALGPALCGDALSFSAPASQSLTAGRAAALSLSAQSAKGAPLTWSAAGLPLGLSLDSSTGQITGAPTSAGTSTVTVTVTDADGATASGSFAVTVAAGKTTAVTRSSTGKRRSRSAHRRHARRRHHHRRHRRTRSHTAAGSAARAGKKRR